MVQRAPSGSSVSAWELPAAIGWQVEGDVARRVVHVGVAFAGVAAALFALLYLATGPVELALPNAAASVVLLLIAAVRGVSPAVKVYAAVGGALVLLGTELVIVGGVDNGIAVWFVVPNVGAVLAGKRRTAIACATLSIAEIAGVALAAELGRLPQPIPIPHANLVMAASIIAVLVLCWLFARIVMRTRHRLLFEVEERNRALGEALAEAGVARTAAIEASRAKDRFFANLTHEIRTPLNGISGTAELLQHADLPADQRPLAEALVSSTGALVTLVNAMLDHARLRAGHVDIELGPVDVRRIAAETADLFAAQASSKHLALAVRVADDVPAWVETDGIRLGQVVGNLVANAIKFTARGSVTIQFSSTDPGTGDPRSRLVVEVSDTGVGVAADQLEAIFEPFVQGDATISRTHGGTGLGLAIASQIAELLGGTLGVESVLGEGSRFTLTVPVGVAAGPAVVPGQAAPPAATAGRGIRVLLAEDNDLNRTVAARMLAKLGADVRAAEDGTKAVELATSEAFDLILMDLQMPGLDGIAAAIRIRDHEASGGRPRVPIVAMTGNAPEDYGEECAAAGMDRFLVKPVGMDALSELLEGTPAGAG